MADSLEKYYGELLEVRKYLIKIGPERRQTGTISSKKLEEASVIFCKFESEFSEICKQTHLFNAKELSAINKRRELIGKLFDEIKLLCGLCLKSKISKEKMESFSLKTAVSLLPVMNDDENVTKQLISSIEMYNSLLDDKSKPTLINFILKTRLSESAKLRLSNKYESVELLVDDMKKHLLTKKSFIALQQQLMGSTQGNRSLEDYGKEIENLFVELTISQADGDMQKYEILKPLNEKMAIKRFASGVRNTSLSTIISARNYGNLKDVIRGAKDEETSMPPESSIMNIQNKPSTKYFYSNRGRWFQDRSGYNQLNNFPRGQASQRGQSNQRGRGQSSRGGLRGYPAGRGNQENRGNTNNYSYQRGRQSNNQNSRVNYMNSVTSQSPENDESNTAVSVQNVDEFFREQE